MVQLTYIADSTNSTKWEWHSSSAFPDVSFPPFPSRRYRSLMTKSPIRDKDISMILSEKWPNYHTSTILKNSKHCWDQLKKIWVQLSKNGQIQLPLTSSINTKKTLAIFQGYCIIHVENHRFKYKITNPWFHQSYTAHQSIYGQIQKLDKNFSDVERQVRSQSMYFNVYSAPLFSKYLPNYENECLA